MLKISRVAALTLLAGSVLWSQNNATISGTVTDQSGAPVAKARITAIATATGARTDTVSSDSGAYTLPFLAPGNYDITAEAPGFKQFQQRGVTVDAKAAEPHSQCRRQLCFAIQFGSL